ncbi:hypothetical protein BGZ95_008909 [Linnemannia exigua]|uniref:Threonylcarbamoyl-AMP synthase n=1 Tax=Linnemannia exigua TaxID=604196 RepID=A0AAD4DDV9_9FUNG|nr:hypothetical protein BGZ95_008909 [Linnemannia exigua]
MTTAHPSSTTSSSIHTSALTSATNSTLPAGAAAGNGLTHITAAAAATPVFTTILDTIDPTTITYTSTDLEDPIPEISLPHTRLVLDEAAQILRNGQVVGITTETRIFKAKNRPQDNPLIVHVSSLKMLRSMLKDNTIPPVYTDLIRTYWPGPLTLLFPRSSLIPDEITCGQATVAVRFPSPPIARALISACDRPLAAPSANSSGKPSPTLASHVMDDLAGKIPMVIDGGQCSFGIESTVVDGLRVPPAILRHGGVTFEQIRQVKGMEKVQVYKKHFTDAAMEQAPTTPGMKYRHYSPEAEVVLVEYIRQEADSTSNGSGLTSTTTTTVANGQYGLILKEIEKLKQEGKKRFGILRTSFTTQQNGSTTLQDEREEGVIEFPLGQGSKPEDVARELFRGLRYLDDQKVDCIFVEGISEEDEGLAVMNRLRKAASRTLSLETNEFL